EEEADTEANHNPQPRENQVKLRSVRAHDFKFRLNEATLAGPSCGVLIDKISGAIDLSNSWRDSTPGSGRQENAEGWERVCLQTRMVSSRASGFRPTAMPSPASSARERFFFSGLTPMAGRARIRMWIYWSSCPFEATLLPKRSKSGPASTRRSRWI